MIIAETYDDLPLIVELPQEFITRYDYQIQLWRPEHDRPPFRIDLVHPSERPGPKATPPPASVPRAGLILRREKQSVRLTTAADKESHEIMKSMLQICVDLFNAIEALSRLSYDPCRSKLAHSSQNPRLLRALKMRGGCIAVTALDHKQNLPLFLVSDVAIDEIADIAIVFFLLLEKSILACIDFDLVVGYGGNLVFCGIRLLERNEFGFRSGRRRASLNGRMAASHQHAKWLKVSREVPWHRRLRRRRFITATAKVLYAQKGKRHGMIKRTNKQIRNLHGTAVMIKSDGDNVVKYATRGTNRIIADRAAKGA